MKSSKNNISKIALFLILVGIFAIFYFIRFNKTTNGIYISKNADGILMVDIKNIENHLTYTFLKNPKQWGTTSTKNKFRFSDFGIEKTDYLALFHLEKQPLTQWFLATRIVDTIDFEHSLRKYKFYKTVFKNGLTIYSSKTMKITIVKHNNQILVCNCTKNQIAITLKTAEDLFLKKENLPPYRYEKMIATSNEVTLWIKKNNLLEEDGIININLNESEIVANGQLQFQSKYRKESQFSQNPNALLSFGFNFEMIRNQKISTANSANINKLFGFDLDSVLAYNPTKTELILNEIVEKKDSAVSYDYDDDFNPIKKVIIHSTHEPSFHFSMQTSNSNKIYKYLKTQNAIDNHQTFVNFPFAKTKTSIRNSALTLVANPSKNLKLKTSAPLIGYLNVQFNKLQPNHWRYIIAQNKNLAFLKSFDTFEIHLTKENSLIHFQGLLKTKGEK